MFFVVVHNFLRLTVPWYIGKIINELNSGDHLEDLLQSNILLEQTGFLVGLALCSGIALFFMRWLMIGASRKSEFDLRNDYFSHLLKLDQAWYQENPVGDVMARATNDMNAVRMLLGPGLMYPVNTISTLIIALVLMFSIDTKLTLIGLSPLPILSILVYLISHRFHHGFTEIQKRFSQLNMRVQENLSGIRVVKAFGREQSEVESFTATSQDLYHKNLAIVRLMGLFIPTMTALSGVAVVLIFIFGGQGVMDQKINLGELVAFMQYMFILSWPMTAIGWVTGVVQRGSASWDRILQVMDAEPAISSSPTTEADGTEAGIERGDLRIRNLKFSYSPTEVLRGIDLDLPTGGFLGIIGPTGCGKSTLLQLLPRLLDPPPGTIFLAGRDVTTIPLSTLRNSIAWAGQEPILFSESLADNTDFARDGIDTEERDRAAEAAAVLAEVRSFPDGWDTMIGERGINLSGGQKQRICLTRALLKKAAVLILDAPFSSVDTQTEEAILTALPEIRKEQTLILVSHRVSTIRQADQIVVMEDGVITERGTHTELLARRGYYADLHERQLLEEELSQTEPGQEDQGGESG